MKSKNTAWSEPFPGARELPWVFKAAAGRAYLIIIGLLLVGGATYFWTSRQVVTYQAAALVMVVNRSDTDIASSAESVTHADSIAQKYAAIPLDGPVINAVQAGVPRRSAAQIRAEVRLSALPGQPLIKVMAEDTDSQTATVLANSVAFALAQDLTRRIRKADDAQVAQLQSQVNTLSTDITNTNNAIAAARQKGDSTTSLQAQLQQQQTKLTQLQLQLAQARLEAASVQPTFLVSSLASGAARNGPNLPYNVSLGALAGAITGLGLTLLVELLDGVVRRADDLQRRGKVRPLGEVPSAPTDSARFALSSSMYAAVAQPFRQVWQNLQFQRSEQDGQVLLVSAVESGPFDDWAGINLAVTSASMGRSTLLLDVNWLRPTVETRFKLPTSEWGFFTSLAGIRRSSKEDWLAVEPTNVPGLFAMPVGPLPPRLEKLLQRDVLAELFAVLREQFAQIIVLAPREALPAADGALARQIDSTLLVADAGRTSFRDLKRLVADIDAKQVPLLGAVLLVPAAVSRLPRRATQPLGDRTKQKRRRSSNKRPGRHE